MNAIFKTGIFALALSLVLATNANAGGGVFDALDPCIKARDTFHNERAGIIQQLDRSVSDADSAAAPSEYRDAWMKAKKGQLRETFDTLVAPDLKDNGVQDIDRAYDAWFDRQMAQLSNEDLDRLVTSNFHQELKQVRLEQRAKTEAEIQSAKDELDKSCKMNVGSQAMRGTLAIVLAPVGMVVRNFGVAKNERGEIDKVVAATTGISIKAINENGGLFGGGLSGGEGSFFRKNLGIRF